MLMTPPLYLDYIPVQIMKCVEIENIYNVFCRVTYTMCKYNRKTILAPRWIKIFKNGVCIAKRGEIMATKTLLYKIQQNK
jgi:hypothetical protein